MRTIFSGILDRKGSLEMGLKLERTEGSRLSLFNKGCTTACLKAAGTLPERRQVLINDIIHGPTVSNTVCVCVKTSLPISLLTPSRTKSPWKESQELKLKPNHHLHATYCKPSSAFSSSSCSSSSRGGRGWSLSRRGSWGGRPSVWGSCSRTCSKAGRSDWSWSSGTDWSRYSQACRSHSGRAALVCGPAGREHWDPRWQNPDGKTERYSRQFKLWLYPQWYWNSPWERNSLWSIRFLPC